MNIEIIGGELSQKEIDAYVMHIEEKFPNKEIKSLTINLDGEYVDLKYTFGAPKFQRIRRITGYLVGTVDRFNNAKQAEVRDRTKHQEMEEVV